MPWLAVARRSKAFTHRDGHHPRRTCPGSDAARPAIPQSHHVPAPSCGWLWHGQTGRRGVGDRAVSDPARMSIGLVYIQLASMPITAVPRALRRLGLPGGIAVWPSARRAEIAIAPWGQTLPRRHPAAPALDCPVWSLPVKLASLEFAMKRRNESVGLSLLAADQWPPGGCRTVALLLLRT